MEFCENNNSDVPIFGKVKKKFLRLEKLEVKREEKTEKVREAAGEGFNFESSLGSNLGSCAMKKMNVLIFSVLIFFLIAFQCNSCRCTVVVSITEVTGMPMHYVIEVVAMNIDIDGMAPIDGPTDFEFLWTARSQIYFISCLVFMNCFYINVYI